MEDSHLIHFDLESKGRRRQVHGLFGIFDGHGGREVAQYISKNLVKGLTSISMYKQDQDLGVCVREILMRIDCSLLTKQGQKELHRLRSENPQDVVCVNGALLPVLEHAALTSGKKRGRAVMESGSGSSSSGGGGGDVKGGFRIAAAAVAASGGGPSAKRCKVAKSRMNPEHPIWDKILRIGRERFGDSLRAGSKPEQRFERGTLGVEILSKADAQRYENDPSVLCIDKDELTPPRRPGIDNGSTALVAAVESTDDPNVKRLYVVNAGDSRCVLSRAGRALPMSRDHSPALKDESRRILAAGATISPDGRINGKLNLSRALGDHQFKTLRHKRLEEQVVTSFADIKTTLVTKGEDDFMVLACDGIWDAMTNQQVVDFVSDKIAQGYDFGEAAKQLCHACLARDPEKDPGTDNMSCIIASFFPHSPCIPSSSSCSGSFSSSSGSLSAFSSPLSQ